MSWDCTTSDDPWDGSHPSHFSCGNGWAGSAELLLAQRWEESWDRPLAEWRQQQGITALVANSPFKAETPPG